MPPTIYIALRFITSRKRSLVLSLLGVCFGVAFFILTQAQTQGFERYFIQTILGSSGAIVITDRFQARYTGFEDTEDAAFVSSSGQQRRKYYEGTTNPNLLMRVARQFGNVRSCSPVLKGNITLRSALHTEIASAQGIELKLHLRTTSLGQQVIEGSLNEFRNVPYSLMIGELLAQRLQVSAGDNVSVIGADGDSQSFRVAAIFRSGVNSIDESRAYFHLGILQNLLQKPQTVSMIIVSMREPDRAPALAKHFENLFFHRARSWQERERGNLQIFFALRLSAGITVALVILLAGFGIFNILTMSVLEKVREIAILRSMGYQRQDISAIFLWQGFIVATLGSLLGAAFGALMTFAVSRIPLKVRGILYADSFIVHWSIWHYIYATVIAFIAVLLASYFPARRAANLAPVDTLRGSGQ